MRKPKSSNSAAADLRAKATALRTQADELDQLAEKVEEALA